MALQTLCSAEKTLAQFTDPVTTTPAFLQDGFGSAGDQLPYGGQEYCVPTSTAMALSYLGIDGFNQIGPSSPTLASELNLVQVISGLSATDSLNGTFYNGNPGATNGLKLYLAAEGIGTGSYTLSATYSPTLSTLASLHQTGTVVTLGCDYCNVTTGAFFSGGHCIVLVGQGVNAQGQSSPNTIIANNPLPGAFAPMADAPGNVLQYLNTTPTSGKLAGDAALELDPSQYPTFWGNVRAVMYEATTLTVNPSQLSANHPAAATWTLSGTQTLNLNGGTLPVLAPIAGSGGIALGANGHLQLTATDNSTGANSIDSGTWESTVATGQAFGTGSIAIAQGTVKLSPVAGSANVNLAAASASGSTLTYQNAAEVSLNLDGNASLTFTIGGNTDGATPNLVGGTSGTLVITPGGGTSDLGQAERLVIAGTGANLPPLTNGIASPSVVAKNSDGSAPGDFVSYGPNGFVKATYTLASVTPLASAGSNAVYLADVNQTVPASTTVQVYALNAGSATVGGGTGSVLQVGSQSAGQAGVILNGGTISAKKLAFGAAQGMIYASDAGGTITSVITGTGSVGLTTFGPGVLTLRGANTYTGTTNVNSGTLQAKNSAGSATGSGDIVVHAGAELEISGASAQAGGSGVATVQSGGALLLNGGTLAGTAAFNAGSYLFGTGTVAGTATLSGYIGNGGTPAQLPSYTGVEDITFNGTVTASNAIFAWKLNALDDNYADAGKNWSLLAFLSTSSQLGTSSGNGLDLTLDLGSSVPDPNSGNAFWNSPHQWLVLEDASSYQPYTTFSSPSYSQGYFSMSYNAYVDYTPAVPEPSSALLGGLGLALSTLRRRRQAAACGSRSVNSSFES